MAVAAPTIVRPINRLRRVTLFIDSSVLNTGVTTTYCGGCPMEEPVDGRIVASGGLVGADEVAHPGHDLLAPLAAVEDAVMADPGLLPMDLPCPRYVGRERMCRSGLADAGDVVELAFHRHQRGLDRRGLDRPAATDPD